MVTKLWTNIEFWSANVHMNTTLHIACRRFLEFKDIKIYRITALLKVETHIITSIAASPTGPVIMYVETFKMDATIFIGNIIMCLT
jgi:hypothetical protein